MKRVVRSTSLIAFSVLLAGVWLLMPAYQTRAKEASPTFDGKCAMCHGKDGSGNTPMGKNMKVPDLRSKAVQAKSDAELHDVIAKGKGIMPQYGNQLSKQQIHELVEYIRQLGGKK